MMEAYHIAEYFFFYNLIFTILFFLIAGGISVLAFKIYRLTKKRQLKLFSLSFLAFAIAHIGMFGAEMARILFGEPMQGGHHLMQCPFCFSFWPFLMGLTLTLYLAGLILLVYMTFKVEEVRVPLLLGAVIAASMLFIPRPIFLFHIIATIILFFLAWYYAKSYLKHRHAGNMLVFLAFLFLLLGNLLLAFSIQNVLFFTIGRSLQLVGYGCFLANLILVFKK